MIALKRLGLVIAASMIIIGANEMSKRLSNQGMPSLVSKAEARVGRPLTPVSVAGVARRTARRCAVGAYNC